MKNEFSINKISDFVGNKNEILNLKNSIENESKCLLIKGLPMTGKTTLIKLILKDLKLDYKYILANTLPNKKNINTFINNYISSYDIKSLINNEKVKRVIIIDNLETLNNNHKHCLIELSKIYKKYNQVLIFITNKNHFKFSKIINEICSIIQINNPNNSEIKEYIYKYNNHYDDKKINLLIKKCNNNIKLLNDLLIDKSYINNSIQNSHTLFNIIYKLFINYNSIESVIKYYNHDKYLLPLIFHENYLNFLNKNKEISESDRTKVISNILKSFIHYDQLDNYMYAYQYWDLQDICGLISCSVGSFYINKYSNIEDNINSKFLLSEIAFTSYLNKVSLISINKKTINKLCNIFNVNNIYKLLQIRYLILNTDCENLINHFKLTSKELLTLSKIDKT